jgi:hypothetical protein
LDSDYPWYIRLAIAVGVAIMSAPPLVYILIGLLFIGFGVYRYLAPEPTPAVAVHNNFKAIHEAYPRLGKPLRGAQLSERVDQYRHEHAHIFWVREFLTIFVVPDDPARKVIEQKDNYWLTDKEQFDERAIARELKLQAGKRPPLFGVYKFWRQDPAKWSWIGGRLWQSGLDHSAYFQEFENGVVVGPLAISPPSDDGLVFAIFKDQTWEVRASKAKIKAITQ